MKLYKIETVKNDKYFVDYYLGWLFDGKTYLVRVNATFRKDFPMLFSQAVDMPNKKSCVSDLLA